MFAGTDTVTVMDSLRGSAIIDNVDIEVGGRLGSSVSLRKLGRGAGSAQRVSPGVLVDSVAVGVRLSVSFRKLGLGGGADSAQRVPPGVRGRCWVIGETLG